MEDCNGVGSASRLLHCGAFSPRNPFALSGARRRSRCPDALWCELGARARSWGRAAPPLNVQCRGRCRGGDHGVSAARAPLPSPRSFHVPHSLADGAIALRRRSRHGERLHPHEGCRGREGASLENVNLPGRAAVPARYATISTPSVGSAKPDLTAVGGPLRGRGRRARRPRASSPGPARPSRRRRSHRA